MTATIHEFPACSLSVAERRSAAVDRTVEEADLAETVAETVAYVMAHRGMIDDLVKTDMALAHFLVASMGATRRASQR